MTIWGIWFPPEKMITDYGRPLIFLLMLNLLHQGKPLFEYETGKEQLRCPYCHLTYAFNNQKMRTQLIEKIGKRTESEIEFTTVPFRCIKCALYDPQYPHRFEDPYCPNEEQKAVLMELYQQLVITSQDSHTNYLFLIDGQAGVGKTSTIMYLFRFPEFSCFRVCFSAPTNKALNVMMEKLDDSTEEHPSLHEEADEDDQTLQKTFMTFFKLTKSRTSITVTGETRFETGDSESLQFNYDIVVIDEVSMIEKKPIDCLLVSVAKMTMGKPTIIFMGDDGQLPPVVDTASIIFDRHYQQVNGIKRLVLTQIMRSRDRLSVFSQEIRQLIPFSLETMLSHDLPAIRLKEWCCPQISHYTNRDAWLKEYVVRFKLNLEDTTNNRSSNAPIIIVYTNLECDTLNTECRNLIFDHPQEYYVHGELLVFKGYYCIRRQKLIAVDSDKKITYYVKYYTSEPLIVDNCASCLEMVRPISFSEIYGRMQMNLVSWLSTHVHQQALVHVSNELITKVTSWVIAEDQIQTHDAFLTKHLNTLFKSINKLEHTYLVDHLSTDGRKKLDPLDTDPDHLSIMVIDPAVMDNYLINCDKMRGVIKSHYQELSLYFKSNRSMKLLVDFLFQRIWSMYYYRVYVWPFANTAYGYAITSHKSQGSTYSHIYVNVSNIMGCRKVDALVRSKSLYTSMTRASRSVNVLYQKNILYPIISEGGMMICRTCHKEQPISSFPPNNWSIDKSCADQILSRLQPMQLYMRGETVVMSDKNRNLYQIDRKELNDCHINDAYQYVLDHDLLRSEMERYTTSNLMLAVSMTTSVS
jgi:hypothetical protein